MPIIPYPAFKAAIKEYEDDEETEDDGGMGNESEWLQTYHCVFKNRMFTYFTAFYTKGDEVDRDNHRLSAYF